MSDSSEPLNASRNASRITDLESTDGRRPYDPANPPVSTAPRGAKPAWTADQLRSALRSYDRTPFLDVLADWIECAPSIEAICKLAETKPDKFIVAMTSLSKVAGFSERRELSVDMSVSIKKLSDSQVEDRLATLCQRLGMSLPSVIDARAEVVKTEDQQATENPGPEDLMASENPQDFSA